MLLLVLGFGLWAVLVSIVALLRGEHIREDAALARGCLADLIHLADVTDRTAGETARQIASRYDPALLTLPSRSSFRQPAPPAPGTVDPVGRRVLDGNSERETWLQR